MKTKQLTNLPSFKAPLRIDSITQAIAIGTIAIGVAGTINMAPAQAIALTTGQLTFGSGIPGPGTSDFFFPAANVGNPFSVTFNPSLNPVTPAVVSSTSGAFQTNPSLFPNSNLYNLAPSTGRFSYVSGSAASNNFVYRLADNLDFAFTNGVTVRVAGGSNFGGAYDGAGGLSFQAIGAAGSLINGTDTIATNQLVFSFNEISINGLGNSSGGGYTITASAVPVSQVPEPFTVIGTLVGGAAALRMRKKLANATKN